MAVDPRQRAAQQRASQRPSDPSSAGAARPAASTRPAAAARPSAATRPAAGARSAAAPGRDSDDFARLMQRNTVDVRQAGGTKRRNPVVGKIALGLAVVSAAVDASAFAVFMGGDTNFAFGICFVVVFLTLIAAVLGFVAAVGSFGRWYGAVGVVLAFFANPVILIVIMVFVAPEILTDMGA
ncbi:hypothetical protein NYS55_16950 [Curtobacterium flaccumfaciens pv. flaccumfaciens]|uniref:hypothetical protein n=2 Tax=Microbacteriaceae TaxID=85023 RepID=UPI00217E2D1D|nr:hypothetical protein [Curtobacterium flaccumfaciens]MCS6553109.1 hypothetical protein [Curtobacterium flaccumfaciens pv. flaccumfaciens]